MYVCMYVSMYLCIYVSMYVGRYVCQRYIHVYTLDYAPSLAYPSHPTTADSNQLLKNAHDEQLGYIPSKMQLAQLVACQLPCFFYPNALGDVTLKHCQRGTYVWHPPMAHREGLTLPLPPGRVPL